MMVVGGGDGELHTHAASIPTITDEGIMNSRAGLEVLE